MDFYQKWGIEDIYEFIEAYIEYRSRIQMPKDYSVEELLEAREFLLSWADPELVQERYRELSEMSSHGENDVAWKDLIRDIYNFVGAVHYEGRGIEQNFDTARTYYEIASNMGSIDAMCNLGYIHYYGRTGEKDMSKAYFCFATASAMGSFNAMYKLGDMYNQGLHVNKNAVLAKALYMKAYENLNGELYDYSSPDIYRRMGNVFFYGIDEEIDYLEALKHYQLAEFCGYAKKKTGDPFVDSLIRDVQKKMDVCRNNLVK